MTAKHRSHQPKRHRNTTELERRVRWLERHFKADAVSIARHVARIEIKDAMREHLQDKHNEHRMTVIRQDGREAKGA
jgi:hypothetical protein